MADTCGPMTVEVGEGRDRLVVHFTEHGTVEEFHALWLRDACHCSACRRPSTNERRLDQTTLDPSMTVESVQVDGDQITVVCSDGHKVELSDSFLVDHAPTLNDHSLAPMKDRARKPVGVAERFACDTLDEEDGLRHFVEELWNYGYATVTGVEPTPAGLLDVAHRLGHVLPSNYGLVWEIEATVEPQSEVDSERGLQVHTDLPYRQNPPGVQLILAATTDVEGGASTIVDGFAMAEVLRETHPELWGLLTTTAFNYPYQRPGVHLHRSAPLIELDHAGAYRTIRRAPDLVGSPIVAAEKVPALYEAMRRWADLLDDPANHTVVKLEVGQLIAFDNLRMLHGRTAFALGASGRRHLLGCYMDIDELTNRRALLRSPEPGQ